MLEMLEDSVGLFLGANAPLAKRVYLNTGVGLALVATIAAIAPQIVGYGNVSRLAMFSLIPLFVIPFVINSKSIIRNLCNSTAYALYLGYALCLGCAISPVLASYPIGRLIVAFGLTFVGFLFALSQAKNVKSSDINWMLYGTIAIIAISIVNMFLRLTMLELLVCALGVPVTLAMTSWQISQMNNLSWYSGKDMTRLSILLSLNMLMNIVNLFMYILRLLDIINGDNRRR